MASVDLSTLQKSKLNILPKVFVNNVDGLPKMDISNYVEDITYTCSKNCEASTLQMKGILLDFLNVGDVITLVMDNIVMCKTIVFTITHNRWQEYTVTCYDCLRYLQNEFTYNSENVTAFEVLQKIGTTFNVSNLISSSSKKPTTKVNQFNRVITPAIDVMDWLVLYSSIQEKKDYNLRVNNLGFIEIYQPSENQTDIYIGEGSLLLDYNYSISINERTFTDIKFRYPNTEQGIAMIDGYRSIEYSAKYGVLTMYKDIEENIAVENEGVVRELAQQYGKYYETPFETLTLECIGNPKVLAGTRIALNIPNLYNPKKTSIKHLALSSAASSVNKPIEIKHVIVNKVTHTIRQTEHLMSVECILTEDLLL